MLYVLAANNITIPSYENTCDYPFESTPCPLALGFTPQFPADQQGEAPRFQVQELQHLQETEHQECALCSPYGGLIFFKSTCLPVHTSNGNNKIGNVLPWESSFP